MFKKGIVISLLSLYSCSKNDIINKSMDDNMGKKKLVQITSDDIEFILDERAETFFDGANYLKDFEDWFREKQPLSYSNWLNRQYQENNYDVERNVGMRVSCLSYQLFSGDFEYDINDPKYSPIKGLVEFLNTNPQANLEFYKIFKGYKFNKGVSKNNQY